MDGCNILHTCEERVPYRSQLSLYHSLVLAIAGDWQVQDSSPEVQKDMKEWSCCHRLTVEQESEYGGGHQDLSLKRTSCDVWGSCGEYFENEAWNFSSSCASHG